MIRREGAFVAALIVTVLLSACHLYYALASRMVPSTDEAHYMTGAVSIADGLRSRTLSGAWQGYEDALGFKAPLVCVPAALLMLAGGGLVLPSMVSLVITFFLLGIASYSLFRHCLAPFQAAAATVYLLTMPLTTGLTHRFYVELLLVLLCVVFADVLIREPWTSLRWSLLTGAIFGLGLLCKSSFPALVALPVMYSLGLAVRDSAAQVRIVANAAAAGAAGLIVAGPWYARNWRPTLDHARLSTSAPELYYPHWIQADLSVNAWIVVVCFAAAGLVAVGVKLVKGTMKPAQKRAWVILLLLGFTTIFLTAITINKATRYTASALPMIACLAAAAFPRIESERWQRWGLTALAAASTVLALHNSFDILPVAPVRIGDVRIFDDRYPMNVPGWYEDNHPLDRRDFRLAEAEEIVEQDARAHSHSGHSAEARTTILGLLLNHDYFQLLSSAHHAPVHFSWWPGSASSGPGAPDYILGFENFGPVYPGVHFFNYYPELAQDVASGKAPYLVLAHLEGPSQTAIWIYARRH